MTLEFVINSWNLFKPSIPCRENGAGINKYGADERPLVFFLKSSGTLLNILGISQYSAIDRENGSDSSFTRYHSVSSDFTHHHWKTPKVTLQFVKSSWVFHPKYLMECFASLSTALRCFNPILNPNPSAVKGGI